MSNQQETNNESLAVKIDAELKKMYDSGKEEWTPEEIKRSGAKFTYNELFDAYQEDEENGIETTNFSLLEVSENSEIFKLTKK